MATTYPVSKKKNKEKKSVLFVHLCDAVGQEMQTFQMHLNALNQLPDSSISGLFTTSHVIDAIKN